MNNGRGHERAFQMEILFSHDAPQPRCPSFRFRGYQFLSGPSGIQDSVRCHISGHCVCTYHLRPGKIQGDPELA